jgi:hypothetical protein
MLCEFGNLAFFYTRVLQGIHNFVITRSLWIMSQFIHKYLTFASDESFDIQTLS